MQFQKEYNRYKGYCKENLLLNMDKNIGEVITNIGYITLNNDFNNDFKLIIASKKPFNKIYISYFDNTLTTVGKGFYNEEINGEKLVPYYMYDNVKFNKNPSYDKYCDSANSEGYYESIIHITPINVQNFNTIRIGISDSEDDNEFLIREFDKSTENNLSYTLPFDIISKVMGQLSIRFDDFYLFYKKVYSINLAHTTFFYNNIDYNYNIKYNNNKIFYELPKKLVIYDTNIENDENFAASLVNSIINIDLENETFSSSNYISNDFLKENNKGIWRSIIIDDEYSSNKTSILQTGFSKNYITNFISDKKYVTVNNDTLTSLKIFLGSCIPYETYKISRLGRTTSIYDYDYEANKSYSVYGAKQNMLDEKFTYFDDMGINSEYNNFGFNLFEPYKYMSHLFEIDDIHSINGPFFDSKSTFDLNKFTDDITIGFDDNSTFKIEFFDINMESILIYNVIVEGNNNKYNNFNNIDENSDEMILLKERNAKYFRFLFNIKYKGEKVLSDKELNEDLGDYFRKPNFISSSGVMGVPYFVGGSFNLNDFSSLKDLLFFNPNNIVFDNSNLLEEVNENTGENYFITNEITVFPNSWDKRHDLDDYINKGAVFYAFLNNSSDFENSDVKIIVKQYDENDELINSDGNTIFSNYAQWKHEIDLDQSYIRSTFRKDNRTKKINICVKYSSSSTKEISLANSLIQLGHINKVLVESGVTDYWVTANYGNDVKIIVMDESYDNDVSYNPYPDENVMTYKHFQTNSVNSDACLGGMNIDAGLQGEETDKKGKLRYCGVKNKTYSHGGLVTDTLFGNGNYTYGLLPKGKFYFLAVGASSYVTSAPKKIINDLNKYYLNNSDIETIIKDDDESRDIVALNQSYGGWNLISNKNSLTDNNVINMKDKYNIVTIRSSGNEHQAAYLPNSSSDTIDVISVGAAEYNKFHDYIAPYSSGSYLLDFCGYSNYICSNFHGRLTEFHGTSASAPYLTGVYAIVYSVLKKYMNCNNENNEIIKPKVDDVLSELNKMTKDLLVPEEYQGRGLVSMKYYHNDKVYLPKEAFDI